jgi:Holliday junction DNA helicase RuvB
VTSGPAIERQGELAAILTHLGQGEVLFIDEIHRLKKPLEELLYTAMEQFALDVMIGEGPKARAVRLPLSRFTLIGATTRQGLLSAPLRSRFALNFHLDFYHPKELEQILDHYARRWGMNLNQEGLQELSRCAKGTPRVGLSLLKRVRDYAQVSQATRIDQELIVKALALNGVDIHGLNSMDRKILSVMVEKFQGGPVGIETIASAIMEEKDTIEDVYEPYLLREGIIHKTPRGRVVTERGYAIMKERRPGTPKKSKDLFEGP